MHTITVTTAVTLAAVVVAGAGGGWMNQPVTVPLWALVAALIVPVGWILQAMREVASNRLGVELEGGG